MNNIFQINQEYLNLTNEIIEQGGEVTPEQEQQLAITESQLQGKAIAYGYVVNKLEYDCDIIDQEIKRLQAIKKSNLSTIERMKSTVANAMQNFGINEVKSETMKLSFRKSETCEIDNEKLIPAKFKKEVVTVKIDKAAIKAAIKRGEDVQGARLQENQNLQVG